MKIYKMPAINCPVVAYTPKLATMPNIAIKQLKPSALEFMIFDKKIINIKISSRSVE